ncbi:cation diffusion facilitator family transporter [Roseburia sp. MUC/MUC-530-WT-4D]|uniref:Cation diffusion facilitator family transporter n=1 Tax=Roseburia porci TaxID=2605790 RepID=A0A6L5YSA4_9FIRM|nr:cation diffusion facilitator family transporter [Roseburia porci]MDD6743957.1 cation diffusion facilitator family transporter [Roseburia porci]MST74806.1 cation diffusion facilitator family transporter [Roseburia porci]
MNSENKQKIEERIMDLSLIGSILFMIVEGIMAYITHSHSILMDCVFDVTDLVMIGPFLFLVPLLYRPVTERRPYGFAQVESLFLVIKYTVLLVITIQLIIDSVQTILDGGHSVNAGAIAIFEFVIFLGCVALYLLLSYFSKRYESMTIHAELYAWKLDIIGSLGVSLAFALEVILRKTSAAWFGPYIDPIVAIVMALFLIREPIHMIFVNLKSLVLFAPNQEIMDKIRAIAEQSMSTSSYTIQFLDVIQTGRKTWVEIYIDSPNDIITLKTLNRIRDEIRDELRKSFDQIYVEIIPDLPE